MEIKSTIIPDIKLITPQIFTDDRGFFMETYRDEVLKQAGIAATFLQDNHAGSIQGVLRGLHYQIRQPQGKLVRVVSGEVFDVAVDLRQSSGTFGQWIGERLSAENRKMLWIPPGFAHGYYVLSDWADLLYKVTDYYAPDWDRTLRWDDPAVGIEWPLIEGKTPLLSEKDSRGTLIGEADLFP